MAVPVLSSRIDRTDERFRQNAVAFDALVADLRAELAAVRLDGPVTSRERHVARGKMLPSDRVDALLDPGSPFLELSPMAAHGMHRGQERRWSTPWLLAVIDPAPTSEEDDGLRPVS